MSNVTAAHIPETISCGHITLTRVPFTTGYSYIARLANAIQMLEPIKVPMFIYKDLNISIRYGVHSFTFREMPDETCMTKIILRLTEYGNILYSKSGISDYRYTLDSRRSWEELIPTHTHLKDEMLCGFRYLDGHEYKEVILDDFEEIIFKHDVAADKCFEVTYIVNKESFVIRSSQICFIGHFSGLEWHECCISTNMPALRVLSDNRKEIIQHILKYIK